MIAFLNESSLAPYGDLRRGLILFWKAALELKSAEAERYKDSQYFQQVAFKKKFAALKLPPPPPGAEVEDQDELEKRLPQDLQGKLREVAFGDVHWQCWRPQRHSDEQDEFSCWEPQQVMRDNSLCEAAELKLQQAGSEVGIVNAEDSAFAKITRLKVSKVGSEQMAELLNFGSIKLVRRWIANQHGYYDPASTVAPKDFQTILEKDSDRFDRTHRYWNVAGKDRRIYKEKGTGRQFYVDEGHPGASAHLEVFNADGKHIGEANINTGVVDTSKCVEGRGIDV
jgi:hypothetical protein